MLLSFSSLYPLPLLFLSLFLHTNSPSISPHRPTAPPLPSTALPPITYSELCLHDEGTFQLDADQYLVPKKHEPREYITVISGDAAC